MGIKYVSVHDSLEDPGGLIREILDMGPAFKSSAEEILFSWLLRLQPGVDPTAAARVVIERYGLAESELPEGSQGKLIQLLRQAASGELPKAKGRRGGWRGRRN